MTLMCLPFRSKGTYSLKGNLPRDNARVHSGSYLLLQGAKHCIPHERLSDPQLPPDVAASGHQSQGGPKQGVFGGRVSAGEGRAARDIVTPRYSKDMSTRSLIVSAIRCNAFLKHLDRAQVDAVVEAMFLQDLQADTYVIKEGEIGIHLYVSAEGRFQISRGGKVLRQFGPGVAFGELAILYNSRRQASIKVLESSRVWVLERTAFQRIMMRTGLQRIEDNVRFLRSVPLLASLNEGVLRKMCDLLQVEYFSPNTTIVQQGDKGDTFYIISGGSVRVSKRSSVTNLEEVLGELHKGEYFGELALMKADSRQATITALEPGVECLVLDREHFVSLLGDLEELREKDWDRTFSSKTSLVSGNRIIGPFEQVCFSDLEVVSTLGVGGFGRVELVFYSKASVSFALKCLKKVHVVEQKQETHVYNEKAVMLACRECPFVSKLFCTYRDSRYVYLLTEACLGGDLFTLLQKHQMFTEKVARFMVACVLEAIAFLHESHFIYRDLKPENLMMDRKGYIKLIDFGFAKKVSPTSKTWTFAGTPEYVAPEVILNKGHDRAVDYWAMGVLLHELLTGRPPFRGSDHMKTYHMILRGIDAIHFPKHVSKTAQGLIKNLCKPIPAERLGYQKAGVQEIREHRWFQGFNWLALQSCNMEPPIPPKIRGPLDISNFDKYPKDTSETPEETSGWDADF